MKLCSHNPGKADVLLAKVGVKGARLKKRTRVRLGRKGREVGGEHIKSC